jgi:hypothetical protein
MLDKLVKEDELWRKMAMQICNDKNTADDLVQDMYLKLANFKGEVKNGYVYFTIKNIYLDQVKQTSLKNRVICINNFSNFETEIDIYDYDKDYDLQSKIDIINVELENDVIDKIIITNHINEGLRKFSRESGISINTIKRFSNDFKNKVWQRKKDLEM